MAGAGSFITGIIPGLTSLGLAFASKTDQKPPFPPIEKKGRMKSQEERKNRARKGFTSTLLAAREAEAPTVGSATLLGTG